MVASTHCSTVRYSIADDATALPLLTWLCVDSRVGRNHTATGPARDHAARLIRISRHAGAARNQAVEPHGKGKEIEMDTARTKRSRCRRMLAIALAGALPALGATVYRSVDAEGKVSFSDTPPAAGTATEVIETRDTYTSPDPDSAERLQQMRETTDRLRADRLAREQERALPPAPALPGLSAARRRATRRRGALAAAVLPALPALARWRASSRRRDHRMPNPSRCPPAPARSVRAD